MVQLCEKDILVFFILYESLLTNNSCFKWMDTPDYFAIVRKYLFKEGGKMLLSAPKWQNKCIIYNTWF